MNLLQHGVNLSVNAIWLGHESMDTTQMYANTKLKEKALVKTKPFRGRLGRTTTVAVRIPSVEH